MDVIVSVTGSSPAYVYMMIEAMGDAAVSIGLSRDSAYRLAAQALIGSATMVRDTGKHPGALKDDVCTPGGTTTRPSAFWRSAVSAAHCLKQCSSATLQVLLPRPKYTRFTASEDIDETKVS